MAIRLFCFYTFYLDMKKLLLLLLSVFVFVSCSDEIPEEKVPVKSGRTVLAYLISNNKSGSLDKYLKQNLVDMYSGLSRTTDSCTLLVYYRPYDGVADGLDGPSILKYSSDGNGNINGHSSLTGGNLNVKNVILESDGISSFRQEQNHISTSPETMKRILSLMVNMSPSDSYGLIFGSHGTSWMPGAKVAGRSFGDDGGYSINIPEMADALDGVFSGKQLDFILFDACMMATAEVCYEFKDVTDYLIGSVMETPVYGFPYNLIIGDLFKNEVSYKDICQKYLSYYVTKKDDYGNSLWGNISVFRTGYIESLANTVYDILPMYAEAFNGMDYTKVVQFGVGDYKYFSFDILDLFKELNGGNQVSGIVDALNDVIVFKGCIEGSEYAYGGIELKEDRFCGIGMYFPFRVAKSSWNSYYESSISWYKAVGWDRFKTLLTTNQ